MTVLRNICRLTLIASLLFAAPALAEPADVVVGLGETVNISQDDGNALVELTRQALISRHQRVIVVHLNGQDETALKATLTRENAKRLVVLDATRVGKAVVILVRQTSGGQFSSQSLQLERISQFTVAAGRLADSVTHGKPFKDTATYGTLTARETRPYGKKHGEFLFGVGVHTGTTLSVATGPAYGAAGKATFEMAHWRIDSELSFLWNDRSNEAESFLFEWTIGTGYVFGNSNTAAFISAGLGLNYMAISRTTPDGFDRTRSDGTGMAGYIGGGVEFFRFYQSRLILDTRLVLPAFTIQDDLGGDPEWVPSVKTSLSFVW